MRVIDERTIAFPSWDGNGMYLSAGNVLVNPHVGLLFIDFERRSRLRLNGVASIDDADPLLAAYPEAQLVVRVQATEVFPNCPRYIHQYRLVERSRFTPREDCATPAPSWKTRDWSRDVLPAGDPALDPEAEILLPKRPRRGSSRSANPSIGDAHRWHTTSWRQPDTACRRHESECRHAPPPAPGVLVPFGEELP